MMTDQLPKMKKGVTYFVLLTSLAAIATGSPINIFNQLCNSYSSINTLSSLYLHCIVKLLEEHVHHEVVNKLYNKRIHVSEVEYNSSHYKLVEKKSVICIMFDIFF